MNMMRNVTSDILVKPDLVFRDKKKKWFIFQPNANLHTCIQQKAPALHQIQNICTVSYIREVPNHKNDDTCARILALPRRFSVLSVVFGASHNGNYRRNRLRNGGRQQWEGDGEGKKRKRITVFKKSHKARQRRDEKAVCSRLWQYRVHPSGIHTQEKQTYHTDSLIVK